MDYEIIAHTADVRIKVKNESLSELFQNACDALNNILVHNYKEKFTDYDKFSLVEVEANDPTGLLIDFLNEVLCLIYSNKALYPKVNFIEFSPTKLKAEISGFDVDGFDLDVKSVTYHEAEIVKNKNNQFETNIILDI